MKTKIVLWGSNENDEKVLLALELLEGENAVKIHVFPENLATEEFYNQMMNLWREGQPVPFPGGHHDITRPMSMAESILPDNLRTERTDILARAKTEWHFVVLSAKLYSAYIDEIQDLRERIDSLGSFDSAIWEEMKSFWSKVQNQVREKNLFKEHANDLRNKTNSLFDSLKSLKRAMDDEFEKLSKQNVDTFNEKLNNIEERIEKGLGLQPIFNELKNLQQVFRDTNFTRRHRSEVWKRLDGAFKLVKEKKYGKKQGESSALARINRRYQGLLAAIEKMESSIAKDKKERVFQQKRIETTDGQLELQIRQAKMAMIDERINSKEQKLHEMRKTKSELESKIEIEKKKEERRKEKEIPAAPVQAPTEQEGTSAGVSGDVSPPQEEGTAEKPKQRREIPIVSVTESESKEEEEVSDEAEPQEDIAPGSGVEEE